MLITLELHLLSNIISQALNKLHNMLVVNKLSLNINKSNYMVFGKGRVTSDIAMTKPKHYTESMKKISWYNY